MFEGASVGRDGRELYTKKETAFDYGGGFFLFSSRWKCKVARWFQNLLIKKLRV